MKILCESCGRLSEAVARVDESGVTLVCSECGKVQTIEAKAAELEGGAPVPAPAEPAAPRLESVLAPGEDEDAAWKAVEAAWQDEKVHRAYLARFGDLDGLAVAGARYKAKLDQRPKDEVALRWRDEILKRATAQALAQLPRAQPPRELSRRTQVLLLTAMLLAFVAAVAWFFTRMPTGAGP